MTNAIIRLMLVLAVLVSLSLVDAREHGRTRTCRSGTRKGDRVATKMWEDLSKDCASGFRGRATKMAGDEFRDKRNASRHKKLFNQCAKKAVEEKIADIERECDSRTACQKGTKAGDQAAADMWDDWHENCDKAPWFEEYATNMADNEFQNKKRATSKDKTFNACAKKAVERKITDIERECDSETPCQKGTDAGDQAAADMWGDWHENCDKAPWFKEYATNMADNEFQNEKRATSKDKTFNACAKRAVDRKITEVEKKCDFN